MRKIEYLFVVFLAFSNAGRAQTTINLPLVIDQMPVGIALVNPASSGAEVSLNAYASDGQLISSAALTLPAGTQTAKLVKEVFNSGVNAKGGIPGWIQIRSTTAGLQGLEIFGDFERIIDGVDGAQPSLDQVLPTAANTSLFISNPDNASTASVTLRFFDAAGTLLQNASLTIPARGSSNPAVPALARHARIVSSIPLAASALFRDLIVSGADQAALNGLDVSSASGQSTAPHAINGLVGAASYSSVLGITNPSDAEQRLTITFTPDDAASVAKDVVLSANGSIQNTIHELFQLADRFQSGWIRLSGTGRVYAFLANVETTSGGMSVVSMQTAPRTEFIFSQTANLPPWLTGLVVLNPSPSALNLEVHAMNPDGTLIGENSSRPATTSMTLPAGGRVAKLIEEILPAFRARQSDGGFIYVRSTNNTPFLAIEQFFLRNNAAAVNVAAGTLPNGMTYAPPVPKEKVVAVSFWNTPDCSGDPVGTNYFPVSYGSDRCYSWPGRSGENSASNFVCSENSMSYTQWTTLTCSGGQNPPGTRKTTYTDRCTQDFPPTLYSRIVDFAGCR